MSLVKMLRVLRAWWNKKLLPLLVRVWGSYS